MFAALSTNADFFRPKMKGAFLIAPVSRVENMLSPLARQLKDSKEAFDAFKAMGPEIMTAPAAVDLIDQVKGQMTEKLNNAVAAASSDGCPENISKIGKSNGDKFFPAGSCFRQIHHFHQLLHEGGFRKFRFETSEENMKAYGQLDPPEYELNKIEGFCIRLIAGSKDLMASPDDYNWLKD